jgi:hypothetical protein
MLGDSLSGTCSFRKTIVSWVMKKTGPPAVPVSSVDSLSDYDEDSVVLLGYFSKLEVGH